MKIVRDKYLVFKKGQKKLFDSTYLVIGAKYQYLILVRNHRSST